MEINNNPDGVINLKQQLDDLEREKHRLQLLISMTYSYKKAVKEIDVLIRQINRFLKDK